MSGIYLSLNYLDMITRVARELPDAQRDAFFKTCADPIRPRAHCLEPHDVARAVDIARQMFPNDA